MKTAKWTISITRDINRMMEVNDYNKESIYKLLPFIHIQFQMESTCKKYCNQVKNIAISQNYKHALCKRNPNNVVINN